MRHFLAMLGMLTIATVIATPIRGADKSTSLKVGVEGGLGGSRYVGSDAPSGSTSRTGIMAGGFIEIAISSEFTLRPEVMYVQKGGVERIGRFGSATKFIDQLNYLEIPDLH